MNGATRTARRFPRTTPAPSSTPCGGAFYGPLGSRTVPESQRWFATADRPPHFAQRIGELKSKGAELIVIFGIGGVCHADAELKLFRASRLRLLGWGCMTAGLRRRVRGVVPAVSRVLPGGQGSACRDSATAVL